MFVKRFLPAFACVWLLCTSCHRHKGPVPRPDHVIIVMEENHGFNQLIGSDNAPFINHLANTGALFMDAHGVTHPSQPNYLALYSGSLQGITDDRCLEKLSPYHTPNLGAALIEHGYTFKGFAETMPSAGYLPCSFQHTDLTNGMLYARKHAPWVNWTGTGERTISPELSRPFTDFPTDFNELPDVAFVIPNQDNDMHNIGEPGDSAAIRRGDNWLKEHLEKYIDWAQTHNSLLILTFDEDDFQDVNHIPTIFHGAAVQPGQYPQRIDHYSVLRTVEAMFDLPTEDSTGATAITNVWRKG